MSDKSSELQVESKKKHQKRPSKKDVETQTDEINVATKNIRIGNSITEERMVEDLDNLNINKLHQEWDLSDFKEEKHLLSIIRDVLCKGAVTTAALLPMIISELEKRNQVMQLLSVKGEEYLDKFLKSRSLFFETDKMTMLWRNRPLGHAVHVSMLASYFMNKTQDWIPLETIVREFSEEMKIGQSDDWRETDEERLVKYGIENTGITPTTRLTLLCFIGNHPDIFAVRESATERSELDIALAGAARLIPSVMNRSCHPYQSEKVDKSRYYRYEAMIEVKKKHGYAKATITSEPYVGKTLVIYSNDVGKDVFNGTNGQEGLCVGMKVTGLMHPTSNMAQAFRACSLEYCEQ